VKKSEVCALRAGLRKSKAFGKQRDYSINQSIIYPFIYRRSSSYTFGG